MMLSASAIELRAQAEPKLTKVDIDRMMTDLSNWGRWGKEDQLGAINLITPEKRKFAASLVQEGVSVSLARDVEKERADDNPKPFEHVMTLTGSTHRREWSVDTYSVDYHSFAHTTSTLCATCFIRGKCIMDSSGTK